MSRRTGAGKGKPAPGALDAAFGLGGTLTTDFGGSDAALAVAAAPNHRIVAAGRTDGDFAVSRYRSDGTYDLTFDGDGKVVTT